MIRFCSIPLWSGSVSRRRRVAEQMPETENANLEPGAAALAKAMDPAHAIPDVAALRQILGEPKYFAEHKFTTALTGTQADFVARSPLCMLGTADAQGACSVSPKGDLPGFVRVLSAEVLAFPERPGNKLCVSLQNLLENPQVELLFLVPNTCETLRVSGRARLSRDPSLCRELATGGQDAILVVLVHLRQCYYHCAKSLIRAQVWKPGTWPETRFRTLLGRQLAKVLKAEDEESWAAEYEEGYKGRVQEVEAHYVDRVWAELPQRRSSRALRSPPSHLAAGRAKKGQGCDVDDGNAVASDSSGRLSAALPGVAALRLRGGKSELGRELAAASALVLLGALAGAAFGAGLLGGRGPRTARGGGAPG